MQRLWRIATQGPAGAPMISAAREQPTIQDAGTPLGLPVIYASTSIALACLETVVHVTGYQGLPLRRWLVAIDVPAEHWQQRFSLEPTQLPGWDDTPAGTSSRGWGDRWMQQQGSLIALAEAAGLPIGAWWGSRRS